MTKRIKQWGKIKLWETSCCGIPMYPEAHKSYSLIKALTEANVFQETPSDQLNLEENQMPEEEKKVEEKPEETPDKPEEVVEEKSEEAEKPEETEEPKIEASVNTKNMTDILAKAITQAIADAEVTRGLVSPEANAEAMKEVIAKKSLGELAMMQGLFKDTPAIGDPVGVQ